MPSSSRTNPSTWTTVHLAATMADTRKIVLGLLGIYLVIIANIAIVDGDIVEVTTGSVVTDGDEATTVQMDVTTNADEGDLEVSTTGATECISGCDGQGIPQGGAQKEEMQMAVGESSTVETTGTGTVNEAATTNQNIEANTGDGTSTVTPAPICFTPGIQADPTDCRAYHDCSSIGFSDGNYHSVNKFCKANEAFSAEFGRCSRDISTCPTNVVCLLKGGIADPYSNSSYYWCEPRLIGGGFRIFHVNCSVIERFYPELGKCFIDFNNMPQPPYTSVPQYNWNQIKDVDIVKAEIKLIKEQDKSKLKVEKERMKAEQRLQKEQQKLMKEMAKQNAASFVCPQAGNFPSPLSESFFYMCVPKKTTFKVVLMECPIGSIFSAVSGTCIIGTPQNSTTLVANAAQGTF